MKVQLESSESVFQLSVSLCIYNVSFSITCQYPWPRGPFKGELNPNNKLGLNDSFCTRINKYNPHTVQFCVV